MGFVCSIMACIHLKDLNIPLKGQLFNLFLENCVYVYGFCHNMFAEKLNNLNCFSLNLDMFKQVCIFWATIYFQRESI